MTIYVDVLITCLLWPAFPLITQNTLPSKDVDTCSTVVASTPVNERF